MSTSFKVIIGTLTVLVGVFIFYAMTLQDGSAASSGQTTGTTQSSASESTIPPTTSHEPSAATPSGSGWAKSPSLFVSRWNSMAKDPYKLSPFDNSGNASVFQGSVTYFHTDSGEGVYAIDLTSKPLTIGACGMGYAAATGVSADIGLEVAKAAINNMQTLNDSGHASLGGHAMTIGPDGNSTICMIYEHTGR